MKKYFFFWCVILTAITGFSQSVADRINYADQVYYNNPDTTFYICNDIYANEYNELSDSMKIEVHLCLGRYNLLKNLFSAASENFNTAITLAKASPDNYRQLATAYHLKGLLRGKMGTDDQEIELIKTALQIYTQHNDSLGMRHEITGLFYAYNNLNDTAGMRHSLELIKPFEHQIKGSKKYYLHQNNGIYHLNIGDYNQALGDFQKAFMVALNEKMLDSKATILMFLGKAENALQNYSKAADYINTAIELSKNNNLVHEWMEALEVGMDVAKNQKNFQKAFRYNQTYDSLKQEIFNLERINNIEFIEKKLQLADKENQIVQKELALKDEKLKSKEAENKFIIILYALIFTIVLVVFILFIIWRLRKLNHKIEAQKNSIEEKNEIIQATLDHLNDSLRYSEHLQNSLLPSEDKLSKLLTDPFVFYQPKEIVSGDFYWAEEYNGNVFFAVADCTGHGVPGAMVSMVCINALNSAIKEKNLTDPGEILEFCSEKIKNNFNTSDKFRINDGMDIALISLQKSKQSENENESVGHLEPVERSHSLCYAGAHNPLWIVSQKDTILIDEKNTVPNISENNHHLFEVKAVKRPVGNSLVDRQFKSHTLTLNNDDSIYIFSDGYADQFGSDETEPNKPGGKKFKYKQLKKLILSIIEESPQKQEEVLKTTIDQWMGDFEQIDDICVMGVKFK